MKEGLENAGGVVIRYGLGGPGIEPWWRRDFPHPSIPALRATQTPAQGLPGLSSGLPGVKRQERVVDHSAPRLKTEYSYTSNSPLGLHWLF